MWNVPRRGRWRSQEAFKHLQMFDIGLDRGAYGVVYEDGGRGTLLLCRRGRVQQAFTHLRMVGIADAYEEPWQRFCATSCTTRAPLAGTCVVRVPRS